jgi:2-(1,2-epoxy-1,2-dihydrophenyl)acetyl-CoA isomerase
MNKVLYGVKSGVAKIAINRPEVLNAVDSETLKQLLTFVEDASADPEVDAVIITGRDRAFCVGADLKFFAGYYAPGKTVPYGDFIRNYLNRLILKIVDMPKPVICAINGITAGAGIGIALSCDFKIAVESASFKDAFLDVGLIPDAGTAYFLARSMPISRVTEFLTLGGTLSSEELLRYSLVNEVVKDGELDSEATRIAALYAGKPVHAVGMTKTIIKASLKSTLEEMLEKESFLQELQGNSEEHRVLIDAFLRRIRSSTKSDSGRTDAGKD